MALLLAGIDEAGYGPTLGPLAVGCSLFRLRECDDPSGSPDLWEVLKAGICREPGRSGKPDRRGRVAIADSKQLKLSNSVTTTHPLVHLERGVLAMAGLIGALPTADSALLSLLGAAIPGHACYGGADVPLPIAHRLEQIAIASSMAAGALENAGVELVSMRCSLMAESMFNGIVRETGSKAEATTSLIVEHVRNAWDQLQRSPEGTRFGLVCDRQGGRMAYTGLLQRAIPDASVTVVEQSPDRSRYIVEANGRRGGFAFVVEGEQNHLPVALASMVAKFCRELAMIRFNRHWSEVSQRLRGGAVRPTAGYAQDAQRWLQDMVDVIRDEDRAQLVRIA